MVEEIQIEKFPLVIFTDCHNNIENVKKLISLYPNNQIISLGDITNLYKTDNINNKTIQFFIDNEIPTLIGNHEQYILLSKIKDETLTHVIGVERNKYTEYLKNLPVGFKLILPDNTNYFCYHHSPKDLWGFFDEYSLSDEDIKNNYPLDLKTIGIIHGHLHKNFMVRYSKININRFSIGSLKNGFYGVLDKKGVKFNQL